MDSMKELPSDEEIRQSFARQVALFSGVDSPFARRSASSTSWVEPLDDEMIVLDVACGAAHVAEQVAPLVRQVVGVDLTPALLRLGHDRVRQAGLTNLLLLEGNVADLPFLEGSFDLVFCRSALHHFRNPGAAVREMARVCRAGGRVVVSDMVAPRADVRASFDELHRHLDPSHIGVLLREEMVALLANEVGPICFAELSESFRLPLTHILHDASNPEAVDATLAAEMAGGQPSGFQPEADPDSGQISVAFSSATVQATRG
jgi:ubiquinone/menaquinone biosynthesis C-methylase UbiE